MLFNEIQFLFLNAGHKMNDVNCLVAIVSENDCM